MRNIAQKHPSDSHPESEDSKKWKKSVNANRSSDFDFGSDRTTEDRALQPASEHAYPIEQLEKLEDHASNSHRVILRDMLRLLPYGAVSLKK